MLGANDIATLGKIPSAPANLTASIASDTVIRLSWANTSAFATGVKIERATSAGGPFVQVGQVGAGVTSFNDNSLTAGVQYFYRVRATASAGDSGYSNVASTTAMAASKRLRTTRESRAQRSTQIASTGQNR